jgi:hypothetical protein
MDFRVVRVSPGQIALQWDISGFVQHPLQVYIQRSGSFTGPFVEIAGPVVDYDTYNDTALQRGSTPYYRLRVVRDGEDLYIPPSGGHTVAPTETLEIAEVRYQLYMDLYYAQDLCLYYPVRTSGQRCSCYDTVTGRKQPKCLSCFGTGYVGGFFNPIVLPAKRTPKQAGQSGDTDREKGEAITCLFPGVFLMRKGDVFVDGTNDRFLVARASATRYRGSMVRQSVVAFPVQTDNLLMQLPADLGLLDRPAHLIYEGMS